MHDGPHHLPHEHAHGHEHGHGHHHHRHAPPGHNGGAAAVQWQTPHLPPGQATAASAPPERDLDLVEAAFAEGFLRCSDATSFLRLAGVGFAARGAAGERLSLLRVEIEDVTDIGGVTPLLGGAGLRYDPLPERLVSRRRRLHFVYHDGEALRRLDFAAARALPPADPAGG